MNSWLKLLLILAASYFIITSMRDGWGGSGGEMPKSVASVLAQGKTLDRKVVFLITGSAWCPACQQMERSMLTTSEWTTFAGKEIVFKVYDYPNGGEAASPAHEDLLKLPGFQGFPTLVVATGSGKLLDMKAGFGGSATDYIAWIRSL